MFPDSPSSLNRLKSALLDLYRKQPRRMVCSPAMKTFSSSPRSATFRIKKKRYVYTTNRNLLVSLLNLAAW